MNEIANANQGMQMVIAIIYKGEVPRQEYFYIQDDLFSKYDDEIVNFITDKKILEATFKTNSWKKYPNILIGISKEQEIKDIKQIKILKEINGYMLFSN